MKARNLLLSLTVGALVTLQASAANALLVKVSVNFGPTITGPDNGTLIVTANPGDTLRITWALGTDSSIDAVPEPATPLLLGLGLAAFAGFHRKLRA